MLSFLLVVQSLSHVWVFVTPWSRMPSFHVLHHLLDLLKLMSIESVMPSNDLILCHPLLLLPSIFPSIRVFSNELALCMVARVLEFQLQHQSFQWIFRTDFLQDGLGGSPYSPRHSQESSLTPRFKISILLCSAFSIAQLSHPYMTTGETIALTR